jgi:hypothetical protein
VDVFNNLCLFSDRHFFPRCLNQGNFFSAPPRAPIEGQRPRRFRNKMRSEGRSRSAGLVRPFETLAPFTSKSQEWLVAAVMAKSCCRFWPLSPPCPWHSIASLSNGRKECSRLLQSGPTPPRPTPERHAPRRHISAAPAGHRPSPAYHAPSATSSHVCDALREAGESCGLHRVERLMRKHKIKAIRGNRAAHAIVRSSFHHRAWHLQRAFTLDAPNLV